jgi:hypothetical protein
MTTLRVRDRGGQPADPAADDDDLHHTHTPPGRQLSRMR